MNEWESKYLLTFLVCANIQLLVIGRNLRNNWCCVHLNIGWDAAAGRVLGLNVFFVDIDGVDRLTEAVASVTTPSNIDVDR